MYYSSQPAWRNHIAGLYYNCTFNGYLQRYYLAQVDMQAHATIIGTTSRTVLTQTFVNPSTTRGIKEVRYTFPLYEGVSVVGFTCHVGDRTIIGEVKEKEKARAVFQEAVARGETAGLLEQLPEASDVFSTTVGNIPPDAKIIVKITYLGELKHDMEVDGIRFTIPNVICPRYGSYPGSVRTSPAADALGGTISITVDAEMEDGSFIQKMQSPTHPISMTMGTTSFAPNAEPTMTKASATLALGQVGLDEDFVLQVIAKNTGIPKAVLENHPTIPNQRALMATLVPKFSLPAEKPEVVFVVDRSGSMSGSNMTLAVQALQIFLKSLPVGVKFNICSFGTRYTFLWKKSVTYSQKTLDEATKHVKEINANYGGTEMLNPLKATIEQRYKDMPLEVMLLTDGEIWNQQALFDYLNKSVTESKEPIRIFTLGIGNGVSHALIEGVAKAGNGFSQSVGDGEKMDSKVVRMLKGALSPHVNDYTLELKYPNSTASDEDDFEIVEKVADSLKVKLDLGKGEKKAKEIVGFQSQTMRDFFTDYYQKKPISLFDTTVDPDKEEPPKYDETGEERYAHLPKVPVPNVLQAPQNIPSLFAFNRTTVYLLLGPKAPQATPRSVVLRGTSKHGPLELEIPVQVLDLPGETIHQLAAKKAISELEQGRGWLSEAKNESGTLLKTKFEGRFEDMVEREAVRLGVQFQVGGKWCSFVAVESNRRNVEAKKDQDSEAWEWLEDEAPDNNGPPGYNNSEFPTSPSYSPISSDSEDDADEVDANIATLSEAAANLSRLAKETNEEVQSQNAMLGRLHNGPANIDGSPGHHMTDPAQIMGFHMAQQQQAQQQAAVQQMAQQQQQAMFHASSARGASKMRKSSASPRSAVSLMKSNIASVTERGERLDTLAAKTGSLSDQSKAFYGSAKPQSSGLFGGMFGSSAPKAPTTGGGGVFSKMSSSLFGSSSSSSSPAPAHASYAPAAYSYAPTSPGASLGAAPTGAAPVFGNAPGFGAAAASIPPPSAAQSDALRDYQMQHMLLEQQNKKRLLMARQEHDNAAPAFGAAAPSLAAPPRGGPPPPQAATNPFAMNTMLPAAAPSANAPPPPPAAPAPARRSSPPAPVVQEFGADLSFGPDDGASALENFDFDSFLHGSGADEMDIDTFDFSFDDAGAAAPTPAPGPLKNTATRKRAAGSLFASKKSKAAPPQAQAQAQAQAKPKPQTQPKRTPEQLLHHLISLQTFEGSWTMSAELVACVEAAGFSVNKAVLQGEITRGTESSVVATAFVVAVFEGVLGAWRGSWELVVEKARDWLGGEGEKVVGRVGGCVGA